MTECSVNGNAMLVVPPYSQKLLAGMAPVRGLVNTFSPMSSGIFSWRAWHQDYNL